MLKTKLGASGFVVDVAGGAADAVAALELINYDTAVLDPGSPRRRRALRHGGGTAHMRDRGS
jgi:DNA-binding response OmpR family regulator